MLHLASYAALIRYLWINEHIQKRKNIYVFDGVLFFVSDLVFVLPKVLEIAMEFGLDSDYSYQNKSELHSFQFRDYKYPSFQWVFF